MQDMNVLNRGQPGIRKPSLDTSDGQINQMPTTLIDNRYDEKKVKKTQILSKSNNCNLGNTDVAAVTTRLSK